MVSLVRASLAPTRPAKSLPTSKRSNGIDQLSAMAFAVKDFPVPCGPSNRTPFGRGRPKAFASAENAIYLCSSHFFRASNPPISSWVAFVSQYSRTSLLAIFCLFSSSTSVKSSLPNFPL